MLTIKRATTLRPLEQGPRHRGERLREFARHCNPQREYCSQCGFGHTNPRSAFVIPPIIIASCNVAFFREPRAASSDAFNAVTLHPPSAYIW
jgi:hypothetical protein